MGRVGTYLNFQGRTEEAFALYANVFGTEPVSITRFSDVPFGPPVADEEKNMIMNMQLPIMADHMLMGTDMLTSMGHQTRIGNNTTLVLEVDSRSEADRIYDALSVDSTESQAMSDMPWGAYWGVCLDRFGIRWMVSHTPA